MALIPLILPDTVGISVGSAVSKNARVLKAQFGDNYAQRAGDGLNPIDTELSFMIENLTRVEGKVVLDFFAERAGYQAFTYTLPEESTPRMWTCEKWDYSYSSQIHMTVSATFKEVFTP